MGRAAWRGLGVGWLALVLWLTLRSTPAQTATVALLPWHCIACGAEGFADLWLNVLLFLPFGIAARAVGWPLRRTLLTFACLSAGIEVAQGNLLAGRAASLGDVLANSGGAIIGWLSLPWFASLLHPTARFAWRAGSALFLLMLAVWIATAVALRPALERTDSWLGQLRPSSAFTEPFDGEVSQVIVNGIPVREGVFDPPPVSRDSLEVVVRFTRASRTQPLHTAVLTRVKDSNGNLEVHVSQVGEALVLEARVTGSHWRLHTPSWRFDSALSIPLHLPWRFVVRLEPGAVVLTSAADDGSQPPTRARRTMSVASGWVFVHPFVSVVGSGERLWTACWLAGWFALLGWLAGTIGGMVRWIAGALALVALALTGSVLALPVSAFELSIAAASYLLLAALRHRSPS